MQTIPRHRITQMPRLRALAVMTSLALLTACGGETSGVGSASDTGSTLQPNEAGNTSTGNGNNNAANGSNTADNSGGNGSGSGSGNGNGTVATLPCIADNWCVGAASDSIAPSAKHLAGVMESDFPSARLQKFGLGGYGNVANLIDPTKLNISFGDATGNYAEKEDLDGDATIGVRVMYLSIPGKSEIAFVTLDAIGTGNLIQKGIKNAITAATGIPADNILVGSSHSHSAPDLQGLWGGVPATWLNCTMADAALDGCGEDDKWTAGLYQRAAAAVKRAKTSAVRAQLETATREANLNQTRSPKAVPDQSTDKALTVLKATAMGSNTTVGTIVQYAAHPTILGSDNRLTHTDYVHATRATVEKAYGGVALYYNGPIGDASASGDPQTQCRTVDSMVFKAPDPKLAASYCRANSYGKLLGNTAVALIGDSSLRKPVEPRLNVAHRMAVLPVTNPLFLAAGLIRAFNRYYNFVETPVDDIPQVTLLRNSLPQVAPTASTTVSRITLGNPAAGKGLEMATIPGEGRNGLGQLLRKLAYGNESKGKPMMLLGLTHNSFGYLIPEEEFSGPLPKNSQYEVFYEETVSLGPLTAPLLRYQAYFPLFNVAPEFYAPAYLAACQGAPDSDACLVKILQFRSPNQNDIMNLPNEFPR